MLRKFAFVVSTLCATAALAAPEKLTGSVLKSKVPGATIAIDTPIGTQIPMRFGADGLVNGEAGALALYLGAAKDRGRWWVAGDRLCIKWFRWFESEPRCLDLTLDGKRILWRKEDGEQGTATLIEDAPAAQPAATVAAAEAPAPKAPERIAALERALRPEQQMQLAGPRPDEPDASGEAQPDAQLDEQPAQWPSPQTQPALAPAAPASLESRAPQPNRDGGPAVGNKLTGGLSPIRPLTKTAQKPAAPPKPPRQKVATASAAPAGAASAASPAASPTQPPAIPRPPLGTTTSALPSKAAAKQLPFSPSFRVANVQSYDMLNVRSGPSEYYAPVGIISPRGRGIRIIGACRAEWCPIRHGGINGWVNRYYLAADEAPAR